MRQLITTIARDYPILSRYLGDIAFARLARQLTLAMPDSPMTRSAALPVLLDTLPGWRSRYEVAELATLEQAMKHAFEAADADGHAHLHPSVTLLAFQSNAASIWSALICAETPPRPYRLDRKQWIIVWRQGEKPRFRLLGEDEAQALNSFAHGKPPPLTPFWAGWREAGLVKEARQPAD